MKIPMEIHFRRYRMPTSESDLHLNPESEEQLDKRLGDNRDGWIAAGDIATIA